MKSLVRFKLLLLALCVPAFAWCQQVSTQPSSPGVKETVHLMGPSLAGYDPSDTVISMALNVITVSIQLNSASNGSPAVPVDVVLGQFPAGGYDVNLVSHTDSSSTTTAVGSVHFNVVAKAVGNFTPQYDYTDLWWKPSESGWGMTITQHVSNNLVVAWFTYGIDRQDIWYVILGGTWSNGSFSGNVYRGTGPYFGSANFDPSTVAITQAGVASLTFSDFSHGTFQYSVDGVVGVKNIERQPF